MADNFASSNKYVDSYKHNKCSSALCVKSSQALSKDFQWSQGLDSVVAERCVKTMSHAP